MVRKLTASTSLHDLRLMTYDSIRAKNGQLIGVNWMNTSPVVVLVGNRRNGRTDEPSAWMSNHPVRNAKMDE